MNVHESEKIAALLEADGYQRTETAADADVIVFNTCCIRNTAELKVISHIGETKRYKGKIVCVVGCLSQRDAGKIKEKFPHIRVILGTHNIDKIAESIVQYRATKKNVIEVLGQRDGKDSTQILGVRTSNSINITFGCENYCSYCIVPYVRGKLICRDSAVIEQEFYALKNNRKPIYLLGQNVNSYICPSTGINFPQLLERLCNIKGDFTINFLSSHPKDFSAELVDVIARNHKIERNIHLPMQSGCDRILGLMNRKYTVSQYVEKIELLRRRVAGVKITTDIICGFPTESDEEFLQTVEVMKTIKFNAAFIFPYSRRSGTVADKMEGQIDGKKKRARATELIKVQREISNGIDGYDETISGNKN